MRVIYSPCIVTSKLTIMPKILQLRYLDYNTRRVALTFKIWFKHQAPAVARKLLNLNAQCGTVVSHLDEKYL